jgi:diadenosine tetraphosphate (Ap4A) HIT family hydrolase
MPSVQAISTDDAATLIHQDELWFALGLAGAPGWIMLATRRHGDGVDTLSDDEAATMGSISRMIGRSVRAATAADRVHVVYLGDTNKHFHLGFFPRQAGQEGLFPNDRMIAEMKAGDRAAAAELTAAIRDGLDVAT